jgi:hypothetical protein
MMDVFGGFEFSLGFSVKRREISLKKAAEYSLTHYLPHQF